MNNNWVQIWGQAHSNLSHFYYPSVSKTFRFVINSALSGNSIRIRLSNEYSENDVEIGEITLSKCDEKGSLSGFIKTVTLNSEPSFVLKKGERFLLDECEIDISENDCIAVSIYVKKGDLRSGNLLNNVNLITVNGNVSQERYIENERRKRDKVIEIAGKVFKLCFHKPLPLIESVEIKNHTGASAITVLGDSLCQQGFWTKRFEERIREAFPGRYSVINKSIMGNRILRDFSPRFPCRGLFGVSAINRLQRDVLDFPDTEFVILAEGTNDFVQPGTIAAPASEVASARDVLSGVTEIAERIKNSGKKLVVFNSPMFGDCVDSRPHKEERAKEYNRLLKENEHLFDYLFDQAAVVINPGKTNCTDKQYLGKDYLHYNEKGGSKVADSIDLSVFG